MHDPSKWNITGKGDEQDTSDTRFNANGKVMRDTIDQTQHKVPNFYFEKIKLNLMMLPTKFKNLKNVKSSWSLYIISGL